MEIVLTIFVIGGLFVLVSGRKRSKRPKNRTQSAPPHKPSPKSKTRRESRAVQPGRFDEATAKHLQQERKLSGPAWVIDGDTIRIKNVQIRLFGIDAPELDHPYGKQAKWALHKLCKGHNVRVKITEEDDYGRTVAQCFLPDGRDLSAEMVKRGLAIDWPKFSGGKYAHLEQSDARKRHWKAAARQRGHMHVFHK